MAQRHRLAIAISAGVGMGVLGLGASAQPTSQCTNLANPNASGIWAISSERALPTRFQFQQFKANGESFAGVSGSAPNDVWAVGGDAQFDLNGPGTQFGNGIVYHFDGTQWCRFNDFDLQNQNLIVSLDDVAALAPDDAWAVGTFIGGNVDTIIQHWNGRVWTAVASPDPGDNGTVGGLLTSISAVSAADIWAAGWYEDQAANSHALLAHYDGQAWGAVATPPSGHPIEHAVSFRGSCPSTWWKLGID